MRCSCYFRLCAVLLGPVLSGIAPPATADLSEYFTYKYRSIECLQVACGVLKNNPKVTLLSVDPSPLPAVDPGDTQRVDLEWSVEIGLKSTFKLCVTTAPGAAPTTKDRCVDLLGSTITSTSRTHVTFAESITVPASLRQPAAGFYIRSIQALFFFGSQPQQEVSNVKPFVWPLRLTDLSARSAGV